VSTDSPNPYDGGYQAGVSMWLAPQFPQAPLPATREWAEGVTVDGVARIPCILSASVWMPNGSLKIPSFTNPRTGGPM